MFTVQGDSMDATSETVQGIKTMNRQEKEDQAQIEYLRRWKEKKYKATFYAIGTLQQLKDLQEYMKEHNIQFGKAGK